MQAPRRGVCPDEHQRDLKGSSGFGDENALICSSRRPGGARRELTPENSDGGQMCPSEPTQTNKAAHSSPRYWTPPLTSETPGVAMF